MIENIQTLLTKHEFLKNFPESLLEELVGCATLVQYNEDEYIFREGAQVEQFYLIRKGKVAIEIFSPQKNQIIIQTLEDGDVFGWSWLLPPSISRFSARAVGVTRAIKLEGSCLVKKLDQDHDLGYELLKRFLQVVVDRLEATRLQLLDLYSGNV